MSKEDVINYVMTTPSNPNRAVLEGMLEENGNGGSGYSCYEEMVTLAEETVTTVKKSEESPFAEGEITFEKPVTADIIHVTFNGTEYNCEKAESYGSKFYGTVPTPDGKFIWSKYPFCLDPPNSIIATQTAGTYQVKVEVLVETVEVTDCFKKAVNTSLPTIYVDDKGVADKTWQEVHDTLVNGTPLYLAYHYFDKPSSGKTDSITGVCLITEAHIIIDTKTGDITYEVRGNKRVLVSDTADGYLHLD